MPDLFMLGVGLKTVNLKALYDKYKKTLRSHTIYTRHLNTVV